jgi:hypothetical protein
MNYGRQAEKSTIASKQAQESLQKNLTFLAVLTFYNSHFNAHLM